MYSWHQALWQQLQQARQAKHLPHALLFAGAEGCGHETFIEYLAASLLCLTPSANGQACGHCRSCQVLAAQAHPDFIRIATADDKQTIGIDQVRGLSHFMELKCSYSPCRVALLAEANALNHHAANSLLKVLEEPAGQTHLLLFTTQLSQLLPTIRSRCQIFRMPLPAPDQAIAWLKIQQTIQEPAHLLTLASGKPLTALSLDSGEKLAQRELFLQQLQQLCQGVLTCSQISSHWEKQERAELLDWLLQHLQQQLRQQYREAPGWELYDRLVELKTLATHPLNARLFIENMLVLWVQYQTRRTRTKAA